MIQLIYYGSNSGYCRFAVIIDIIGCFIVGCSLLKIIFYYNLVYLKSRLMVQNLKIARSIHILEAFRLTLFKRICQKWSKKDEVSNLYRNTIDKKEKGHIVISKRNDQ